MILPQPIFRRNNAGRLVTAYDAAFKISGGSIASTWAKVFSVPSNDVLQFSQAIGAMHILLNSVETEIAKSDLPIKEFFPEHVPALRRAITTFNFEEPWNNVLANVRHEGAIVSLKWAATILPEENEIPMAELNALQTELRNFAERVRQTELESDDLKKWILDMLKALDLGITDYFINGAESLRRSTSYVLGEMLRYQEHFVGKKEPASRDWSTRLKEFVFKIAEWADAATRASKAITQIKQLLLPGPGEPGVPPEGGE